MAVPLRDRWSGGSVELAWLLERCLDEATYDLAIRGLDLGQLWRERRWHLLWVLVTRLPRDSLTKEALAQDEEFANHLLAHAASQDDGEPGAIRQSEFSPEVEALYAVVDRLGDVLVGLVKLGNGRPGPIPPMRRPLTALDRVRERRRRETHYDLVTRIVRR